MQALVDRPSTLSELARACDLSAATAHAILAALSEADWVVRDEASRAYRTGPAFTALARAGGGDAVAQVLGELAARLGVPAPLTRRGGGMLVVDASAGAGDRPAPAPGQRVPYTAPFGSVFAAHAGPEDVRDWLGAAAAAGDAVRGLAARLEVVRERGYAIERHGPAALRIVDAVQALRDEAPGPPVDALVTGLLTEIILAEHGHGSGDPHQVSTIAVPVADGTGKVTRTLNVHPFRTMNAREAAAIAEQLTLAATALQNR